MKPAGNSAAWPIARDVLVSPVQRYKRRGPGLLFEQLRPPLSWCFSSLARCLLHRPRRILLNRVSAQKERPGQAASFEQPNLSFYCRRPKRCTALRLCWVVQTSKRTTKQQFGAAAVPRVWISAFCVLSRWRGALISRCGFCLFMLQPRIRNCACPSET